MNTASHSYKKSNAAPTKKVPKPHVSHPSKPRGIRGRAVSARDLQINALKQAILDAKVNHDFAEVGRLTIKLDNFIRSNPAPRTGLKTRNKNTKIKGRIEWIARNLLRGGNEMKEKKNEQDLHAKKAELSREINYFSKLMSDYDQASKNANSFQRKLIELYNSFSNDDARMEWLDKKHETLVSM